MTILSIVCIAFVVLFDCKNRCSLVFFRNEEIILCLVTQSASQCYFCNPCGSTWETSSASIIQTGNTNDYCRVRKVYKKNKTTELCFVRFQ